MEKPYFKVRLSDAYRAKIDRIRTKLEAELGRDVSASDVIRWLLDMVDPGSGEWGAFVTGAVPDVPDRIRITKHGNS